MIAVRIEEALGAGGNQPEGENQNTNTHEGEQVMTIISGFTLGATLATNIHARITRGESGIHTLEHLADRSGIGFDELRHLLDIAPGKLNTGQLWEIAHAFGCDVSDLAHSSTPINEDAPILAEQGEGENQKPAEDSVTNPLLPAGAEELVAAWSRTTCRSAPSSSIP